MKHIRIFESFNTEINDFCSKHGIENYIINEDGSIDVNGDVKITDAKLEEIPIRFNRVEGNYILNTAKLRSLKNSPLYVSGFFRAEFTYIKTLEFSPKYIGTDFDVSYNNISSLKFSPEYIGGCFAIVENNIKNFDYLNVFSDILIMGNPISTLLDIIIMSKDDVELFLDYDIIQDGIIIHDRLNEYYIDMGKSALVKNDIRLNDYN